MADRSLVLVVSADCKLCEQARALLGRLGLSFREVDLAHSEAGELARRGVPVVFFPVLVDGDRVLAYGNISEAEVRRALPLEVGS
jgi:glutaredoxin